MISFTPVLDFPAVDLPAGDENLLRELMVTWKKKRLRNVYRTVYYEGKNALKDFGISIPPQMRNVEMALGWIAMGVNALTDRSQFEGFVAPTGEDDPYDLSGLVADNNFEVEFPQAKVSSAIHACSFLTVSSGDVESGEPDVMVMARAADSSAGVWDRRRRAVRGFLAVLDTDELARPSEMMLFTPEWVYTFAKVDNKWTQSVQENVLGEVGVSTLAYKPELNRPFGHSRITRAGIGYTDSALRTLLRAEVSAEFYSAPEYWLFGADVSAFQDADKWTAVMGRIKALEYEEGDPKPELHRFAGASPQPHTEQLRMWASLFAGDQGLDLSSLGIVQDNPSSAEAIYAAKEKLIMDTRNANRTWGRGAVKAMQLAVRLRDGLDVVPEEMRRMSAAFTDPAIASPQARADAFSKLATNIDGFAESEVGLEKAGLSQEEIKRFNAQKTNQVTGSLVERLAASAQAARSDPAVAAVAP